MFVCKTALVSCHYPISFHPTTTIYVPAVEPRPANVFPPASKPLLVLEQAQRTSVLCPIHASIEVQG